MGGVIWKSLLVAGEAVSATPLLHHILVVVRVFAGAEYVHIQCSVPDLTVQLYWSRGRVNATRLAAQRFEERTN